MKSISIIFLVSLLAACASKPTLEELEKEALETGDWTAVEERQAMYKRQGRVQEGEQCKAGYAYLCDSKGELEECQCVSVRVIRGD